MTRMLLGCALLGLAAGCATAPQKKMVRVVAVNELQETNSSPDKTYVCEEGQKTGSKIPTAICQSVRERELAREAAQDDLHRIMQSGYKR